MDLTAANTNENSDYILSSSVEWPLLGAMEVVATEAFITLTESLRDLLKEKNARGELTLGESVIVSTETHKPMSCGEIAAHTVEAHDFVHAGPAGNTQVVF